MQMFAHHTVPVTRAPRPNDYRQTLIFSLDTALGVIAITS